MKLPRKLVSEFAKVTNNSEKPKNETTVYGVISKNNNSIYARLDGSDVLTPVSTTTDTRDGDRVTVLIKNHTAIVTGNMTSPAARTEEVQQLGDNVSAVTDDNAAITNTLTAMQADIGTLRTDKLSANEAELKYATITNLTATNAEIDSLEATHGAFETATANNFKAVNAKIDNLDADVFSAKYAKIDFANIGKAAMEYLYSKSGLIENVVISDGTITGNLVGVTIKGDLIEGNTVVADKLVIKGQNGLYYKLNTDGVSIEAEQTEYNSLNGSIITAKSITATKISVDDLVAFDATIGGFNITSDALYSGVKESVDNATQGIYLGKDGQLAIGDASNFLKYYKSSDGAYKLDLSLSGKNVETSIADASKTATNFLNYNTTNGLQIGNRSAGSWSGFRTQITSAAFNILDSAGSVLASYGAKLIELGKNATDAIIKLCGGKGQIEYTSDNYLQVSSDKLRLKGDSGASLYSATTNSSGEVERSAVNVTSSSTYIYSGASSITVEPEAMSAITSGNITISAASVQDSHGSFLSVLNGSSGNWTYKKWSNGDVELWGSYTVSGLACTTGMSSGTLTTSMYRTDAFSVTSFPFTVYSPNLIASYESDGYGGILWATSTTTTQGPPSYYLLRPTSATISSGKINFHVYGKWSM